MPQAKANNPDRTRYITRYWHDGDDDEIEELIPYERDQWAYDRFVKLFSVLKKEDAEWLLAKLYNDELDEAEPQMCYCGWLYKKDIELPDDDWSPEFHALAKRYGGSAEEWNNLYYGVPDYPHEAADALSFLVTGKDYTPPKGL